mmetsp:Transcript_36820/g.71855  ORF Transcript_36820/g.71855 Transcript_36820/m.71855 type:complete len:358 (+) Transcript_36820:280-1353(+)
MPNADARADNQDNNQQRQRAPHFGKPAGDLMHMVGSRPRTSATNTIKPTPMGGTVEKLEGRMTGIYSGCRPEPCSRVRPDGTEWKNTILGESFNNLPSTTARWRVPGALLNPQEAAPQRGGRQDPNKSISRPFTPFTIQPTSKHSMRTKSHTGAGYHGIMFSVRANRRGLRITAMHGACTQKPTRELYRIYIKPGPLDASIGNAAAWREVSAGEAELPVAAKTYGMLPFPRDGVKILEGEVVSFYIHCPYNKCGVAFRRFAMAWPGYPAKSVETDGDKDVTILAGQATYSQTPFERVSKECCAWAGLLEYDFKLDLTQELLESRKLNMANSGIGASSGTLGIGSSKTLAASEDAMKK